MRGPMAAGCQRESRPVRQGPLKGARPEALDDNGRSGLLGVTAPDVTHTLRTDSVWLLHRVVATAAPGDCLHQRIEAGVNQHSGCRSMPVLTASADVEESIPRVCSGSFVASLAECRWRIDQTPLPAVMAASICDAAPHLLAFTRFPHAHARKEWFSIPLEHSRRRARAAHQRGRDPAHSDAVARLLAAAVVERYDDRADDRRNLAGERMAKLDDLDDVDMPEGRYWPPWHVDCAKLPPSSTAHAAGRDQVLPSKISHRPWAAPPTPGDAQQEHGHTGARRTELGVEAERLEIPPPAGRERLYLT